MASFGSILEELKRGGAAARVSWPAQLNMMIQLHVPDGRGAMTMPYLYMSVGDNRFPWMPSMDELLADDWNPIKKSKLIIPHKAGIVN
jgi:hypothetical protein